MHNNDIGCWWILYNKYIYKIIISYDDNINNTKTVLILQILQRLIM